MTALSVSPTDLATFLGVGTIDTTRATLLLQLAQDACTAYVTPLPQSALGVVLQIAARAYANPTSAQTASIGPENASWGTKTGVTVYPSERRQLRRLGGLGGGAFTIDPTPVDAGTAVDYWDQNITWPSGEPLIDQES